MSWIRRKFWLLAAALLPASVGSGCNPLAMGVLTPVPIQPWVTERMEDKYLHKNDGRTPIMPPIRDGFPPPICEDPPSDLECLRALHRPHRGIPYVLEEFRDDIYIVKNRLVDKIDPPRFFPLVGPAQLHHCHWECVIYWTETVQSDYPFPCKLKKQRVQVIYIDKDHLHLYVGSDPEMQKQITHDLTKY
ncbi:MAG: hypothetical protein K2P78_07745 [Gemmataceae bacterium]|nr:hypothetical protein [Gemmataceae bacterium]